MATEKKDSKKKDLPPPEELTDEDLDQVSGGGMNTTNTSGPPNLPGSSGS